MTDRRPDVYCNGCGDYCHSLSHNPYANDSPERPFHCDDCNKAISESTKTGGMIEYEWEKESERKLRSLKDRGLIEEVDGFNIGSFILTMTRSSSVFIPKEIYYPSGEVEEMTSDEWEELSLRKLQYYKKYCGKIQLKTLNRFVLEWF